MSLGRTYWVPRPLAHWAMTVAFWGIVRLLIVVTGGTTFGLGAVPRPTAKPPVPESAMRTTAATVQIVLPKPPDLLGPIGGVVVVTTGDTGLTSDTGGTVTEVGAGDGTGGAIGVGG